MEKKWGLFCNRHEVEVAEENLQRVIDNHWAEKQSESGAHRALPVTAWKKAAP